MSKQEEGRERGATVIIRVLGGEGRGKFMHNLKSKKGLCNNTQKVQNVEVKRLINSTTEISKGFLRLHGKNKTNTLNKVKRQMQMAPLKKVFNLTCAKRNTNHIYFDISFFTYYTKI